MVLFRHKYLLNGYESNQQDATIQVNVLFITLVNFQLDAQNSLFVYNTFITILYMFRAIRCSSSEGLGRNCIYAATGSFLNGAQGSHLQRVMIPETAYIQLRRRPPDDEQGNARNL
jgi:hypothetical protein